MQQDNTRVPKWLLQRHRLLVTPEVTLRTSGRSDEIKRLLPKQIKMAHGIYGLWESEIDLSNELCEYLFIYLSIDNSKII